MQNSEELVSIIIPIYNVVDYIDQCVISACNQTYRNIEIILVDDGSTDGSGQKCDSWAKLDLRITVIHKSNGGVSSARNSGVAVAQGTWVCFIDGDDYVTDDYVEYLLQLVHTADSCIGVTTDSFSDWDTSQVRKDVISTIPPEQALINILCYKYLIGAYSKIFRVSLIRDNGIHFFEQLAVGEGFNFNCWAIQCSNSVTSGRRKIYYYRKDNANSVTTNFNAKKWISGLQAIDTIRDNLRFHGEAVRLAWEYAYWRTNSDAYDLIVLSHSEEECSSLYRKTLYVTKHYAYRALIVPVSIQNKIRALIMAIYPRLIPWLMLKRREIHNVEVPTQRR